jgi:hypothetical protein
MYDLTVIVVPRPTDEQPLSDSAYARLYGRAVVNALIACDEPCFIESMARRAGHHGLKALARRENADVARAAWEGAMQS